MIVTVSEEERQVIVLAMAELALRRPGWDWMLRNCAEESFSAGSMFDFLKETSRQGGPNEEVPVPAGSVGRRV